MPAKLTQADLDDFEDLLAGKADHFSALLVRLIRKADPENRFKLGVVFPEHVRAVELFDVSVIGGRLWRCTRCGALNVSDPDPAFEFYPCTCIECLQPGEPPRLARRAEATP